MTAHRLTSTATAGIGQYLANPNPWRAWDTPPAQGENAILYEDWPRKAAFQWDWREDPRYDGKVLAYPHIAYGLHFDRQPAEPVKPVQVGALQQFDYMLDASLINADRVNLLCETWATAKPGDMATRSLEIGIFHSMARASWFDKCELIGRYTYAEREYEARLDPGGGANTRFVMITLADRKPRLSGYFDMRSACRFLVEKGLLDPAHWLNGHSAGFEPIGGARNVGGGFIGQYAVTLR